jgi:hypothetical protein
LRIRAEKEGLTPQLFLCTGVEQIFDQRYEQFQQSANYVLEKNAELYRRLECLTPAMDNQ